MPIPFDLPPAILIVEDQAQLRRLIRTVLTRAGYATLEASRVTAAEEVIRSFSGKIRLAILDIVMPGGSGLDFANQLDIEFPGTKILYISGFVQSVAVESIGRRQPAAILLKPFTGAQLLARVQLMLGQDAPDRSSGRP